MSIVLIVIKKTLGIFLSTKNNRLLRKFILIIILHSISRGGYMKIRQLSSPTLHHVCAQWKVHKLNRPTFLDVAMSEATY